MYLPFSDTDLEMDALLATFEEELTAREKANPPTKPRESSTHCLGAAFWFSRHECSSSVFLMSAASFLL